MTDLGEYLRGLGGKKRKAGDFDCVTIVADWLIAVGCPDPMAHRRGAYDSEEAALGLISEAGGLVALFDQFLGTAGLVEREGDPEVGDVGVVAIRGEEAGAIFTGGRWALVGERGLIFVTLPRSAVPKVWTVRHG
jgi:hypothetical protein